MQFVFLSTQSQSPPNKECSFLKGVVDNSELGYYALNSSILKYYYSAWQFLSTRSITDRQLYSLSLKNKYQLSI